jgi:four helix bundle protein
MAKSIIKQKSYDFALRIVRLSTQLKEDRHYEISSQLFRCGTSIGANVEEALAGLSKKDFFAKMSIASKEARESNYWLRLLKDSEICDSNEVQELIDKSDVLIKILTSIVKTGQENQKQLKTQN